jgi:predicted HTH transcriptional regulator
LLDVATIAHLISDKNASIITLEIRHYTANLAMESDNLTALFMPGFDASPAKLSYTSQRPLSQTSQLSSNPVQKYQVSNENKSKRQDAILSFIDERKSAAIKDIAALFSDTSEKTIQRELSALVSAGKITKRGEKRWSVYMSV